MLKVTDKAKDELKELLLLCTKDGEDGIRLVYGSLGQFGLLLGQEKDGDKVIQHDGSKVLLIGSDLTGLLNGVTMDVENNGRKREFVMTKK